jgi:hypothetical protein
MSKDGLVRVELHTRHRLCGEDVATLILAFRGGGFDVPDIGQRWSRAGLQRFLRDVLCHHGNDSFTWPPESWRDDYEMDDNLAEAVRWAAGLVHELLPELYDDGLRKWVDNELHGVAPQ